MSAPVAAVKAWLETLPPNAHVGIDEDGDALILVVNGEPEYTTYCHVGPEVDR